MPSKLNNGNQTVLGPQAKLSGGVAANPDLTKRGAGLTRGPSMLAKSNSAAWGQVWPANGATLDLDFANDKGFVRGVGQGKSMDAVTFTRASDGTYVGSNGLLQGAGSDKGALGLNQLSFPQNFDNAIWVKGRLTTIPNATISPNSNFYAYALVEDTNPNDHLLYQLNTNQTTSTFSVYLKKNSRSFADIRFYNGAGQWLTVWFDLTNGTVTQTSNVGAIYTSNSSSITDAGNGWWRCVVSATRLSGTTYYAIDLATQGTPSVSANGNEFYTGNGTGSIFIWGAQLELGSSATTYYPTNINTPRFDWANTASTGSGTAASPYAIPLQANATCNGLLIEESRANRLLWCRDATQSSWVKTGITAALNQTGIDGVANACSSLTATLPNGTCVQTVTLALGSRTGSVYIKRLTGTGTVQFSTDGTTWANIDLSNGLWNRVVVSGSVTNPVVGILITTSGDSVAIDYGQIEDGAFATTPIMTTTASVTRAVDTATIGVGNWFNPIKGTVFSDFLVGLGTNGTSRNILSTTSTRILMYLPNGNGVANFDGTNSANTANATPSATVSVGLKYRGVSSYGPKRLATTLVNSLNEVNNFNETYITVTSWTIGASFNSSIARISYIPKQSFKDAMIDIGNAT